MQRLLDIAPEKSKVTFEKLKVGHIVKLLREPNNIYDKDAIAVYNIKNQMLGYIARDDEKELAEFINGETEHEASVTSKKGGKGLSYVADIQVTKVKIDSNINSNEVESNLNGYSVVFEEGIQNNNKNIADKVNRIIDELKKERGIDVLLNTWGDVMSEVERRFTSKEQAEVFEELIRKRKELHEEYSKEIAEQDDGYGNRVDSGSSDPDYWGRSELNEYYGYDEDYEGDWD
jgi:hypothetical protein